MLYRHILWLRWQRSLYWTLGGLLLLRRWLWSDLALDRLRLAEN